MRKSRWDRCVPGIGRATSGELMGVHQVSGVYRQQNDAILCTA